MSNQQAIDEALDQLEIENEEVVDEVVDEAIEAVIKDEPADEIKENPPGYIDNIEDWEAAGKDPKLFKNPELYSAEYERIQEIKDLKSTMQTVVDGVGEWKEQQKQTMAQQVEQAKEDAIAELEQAKEDDDIDAAIKAQDKIHKLDTPKQEVYKPNPVLTEFYDKNPILDKTNSQYDEEVFQDASQFQSVILDELTGGNPKVQLTASQIERSLKVALTKAKALSPDKFVSPRNARKSAPSPARTKVQQKNTDYSSRLRGVKSDGKNKRDTNAANEIYDMLKAKADAEKNPQTKAKALAAVETYAKNVLGE